MEISDDLPEGLVKEIVKAMEALDARLEQDFRGPIASGIHGGKPNIRNLPPGDVNIWLNFNRAIPNEGESSLSADGWESHWQIWAVVRAQDSEYGTNQMQGLKLMGQVHRTATEELSDLDLDGSVDYNLVDEIDHDNAQAPEGDLLDIWMTTIEAHHQLLMFDDY
jgi:hypothetical protein